MNTMNPYHLKIQRIWESYQSTISRFQLGDVKGYFLEPHGPTPQKRILGRRIPVGHYFMKWHPVLNPRFRNNFDGNVPLLYNASVPVGKEIIIHHGTKPLYTNGNLLIGSEWATDALLDSVKKLNELIGAIQNTGIEKIAVTIEDSFIRKK
jgi:hypothetical protein